MINDITNMNVKKNFEWWKQLINKHATNINAKNNTKMKSKQRAIKTCPKDGSQTSAVN